MLISHQMGYVREAKYRYYKIDYELFDDLCEALTQANKHMSDDV